MNNQKDIRNFFNKRVHSADDDTTERHRQRLENLYVVIELDHI